MPGLTPNWSEAEAHAALGLPVTSGKLRSVKKLLGKLLWPFLHHQVIVNRALLAELDAVRARLDRDEFQLLHLADDLQHHSAVLVRHEEPLDRHEFLLKHLEPAISDLVRQLDLVQDKIDLGQRQALARYHEGVGPLRSALTELDQRLDDLEGGLDAASETAARADEAAKAITAGAAAERPWRQALDDVWLRMSQLDLYLAEARRSFPAPVAPEQLAALPSGFDSLHAVFAEAFRGPVPVVKERVAPYLDDLAGLEGPVLDLGCGRGELLEVLAAGGVTAYGIDLDPEYVERGRARGLDVRLEDARAHLAGLEERSLGAVTAIQVVEHLPVDELIEIVELAARAIRPGGLIVLETQNPENVVVGSSSFYLDPTHQRPIPPELLAFLVGARGFGDVEIRRLERADQPQGLERPKPDEPWAESVGSIVDVLNFHLFAPADYAVVGRRP
ncbi:MAG: methyltransferase domain protein [Acidimicrobiaceae bacterium]|nr:methyltransferase domain protein [Acidimicrobiaceae bacterium]